MPPVGLVGPGRAGLGLAVALRRARIPLLGVHGRRELPVPAGVRLTTGPVPPWLGEAGVVVLAVPDDALPGCVAELARAGGVAAGAVALHLSGALASDLLAPLATRGGGAATGSMHPLVAFGPDPAAAARQLAGAAFALEGEVAAVGVADAIVRRIGGTPVTVPPELKPRYHAGAVFASNYVVGLVAAAARLLESTGMGAETALGALLPLVRATVANLEAVGPAAALTGPIARGDAATVRRHLMALSHADADLYKAVGRETLRLARKAGLDEAKAERIEALLR